MRQHAPTLVRPMSAVEKATERNTGILTMLDLATDIAALKRDVADLRATIARTSEPSFDIAAMLTQIGLSDPLQSIDYITAGPIPGSTVKGSTSPASVTSTTGTTITSFNLGPLIENVPYAVIAVASMAANADPAGFIFSMVRIGASGTSVDGMQTGTASGERTLVAPTGTVVIGAGSTINIAARARLSAAGAGSVNDASVWALAIPLYLFAFRQGV
jgi:hypothetical protein